MNPNLALVEPAGLSSALATFRSPLPSLRNKYHASIAQAAGLGLRRTGVVRAPSGEVLELSSA
jgi:hypothetical protein